MVRRTTRKGALAELDINLTEFNRILSDLQDKSLTDFSGKVKEVGFDLLANIQRRTPVGETGNARAGWKFEDSTNQKKEPGFTIFNRVLYIADLEAGHSKQAPGGMVGPALRELAKKLK